MHRSRHFGGPWAGTRSQGSSFDPDKVPAWSHTPPKKDKTVVMLMKSLLSRRILTDLFHATAPLKRRELPPLGVSLVGHLTIAICGLKLCIERLVNTAMLCVEASRPPCPDVSVWATGFTGCPLLQFLGPVTVQWPEGRNGPKN
jgi:hypothetical protein